MKRIWHLDLVRAFCVFWIVVILHNEIIKGSIADIITIGVLGSFTYLSGLLLGKKDINFNSTFIFYWNRIKRLYPFFFLSAFTFLILPIVYINSFKQFIHTITFSCYFYSDMPGTIWYVCMIFIFYFVTPFILFNKKILYKICISVLLFLLFLVLNLKYNCDIRFVYNFPIYAFGLLFGAIKNKNYINLFLLFVFSVISIILYIVFKNNYFNILIAFFMSLFIEYICRFFEDLKINDKIKNFVSSISYVSMLVYLFHRQYNYICEYLTNKLGLDHIFILWVLFLPLFIFCCYNIQKFYDNLLRKNKINT